ncbi:MAG: hypothetical protein QHC78_15910 [Pigmentiphaga sp.]|uniref:hypothetical protein n=1 Tax=Pigmentiphaga sp. TaxID=1977564 RepID=UPI0029A82A02|nr:hypothetical protein [Pigmentiphaga sp.]MDX3907174.1 hypothetical protein [Pigmentiphaga sp.]
MNWKQRGTAHVLGHDVPHDGAVMAFDIVLSRTTDPEELIPRLFAELDPTLIGRIRPGDLIVAGRNFLAGKAHNAGIIAMKALGLGILCESMSVRAFQGVVALAVPALTQCSGITGFVSDGDEIEVDYASGEVRRCASGEVSYYPPLPCEIRTMIQNGGMRGALEAHLRAHPELAQPYAE